MISVSCPVCGQAMRGGSVAEWPYFPFCSARCKTIDMGRWLGESYRIPAEDSEDAPAPESPDIP